MDGIPRDLSTLLYLAVATSLGWVGGWLARRKREPHELRRIDAETRQINTNTDITLIQAASNALAKAERVQVRVEFWKQKAEEWEQRAMQAEADAQAAELFVGQLNAAAKLTICEHHPSGVKLSDYTPRQLNPPKQ